MTLSTLAQATPLVGDYSHFNITLKTEGESISGFLKMTLTDKTADTYNMTTIFHIEGLGTSTDEETVATSDLMNDETITHYLTNCVAEEGKLETITVPAGKFKTCALNLNSDRVWIARVPFGFVKKIEPSAENTNKLTAIYELQSFVNGKTK